jgi:hypothetical protein
MLERMFPDRVFVVALALAGAPASCGTSSDSNSPYCSLDDHATTCADRFTFACFYGATPETNVRCTPQVENRELQETLYCCGP